MKTETVTTIDYHEFETLVKKTYPGAKQYSFVATEECGNDSVHQFTIDGLEPLQDYDAKQIEKLETGEHIPYANYTIFQDLVNKEVLQPGSYLVEVCW